MTQRADPALDLGFSAFIIAVGAAVLWEARRIPPGVFEPLGSGPIPRATAWVLIGLCLAVAWRAVLRMLRDRRSPPPAALSPLQHGDEAPERPVAVLMTAGMAIAYVLALQARLASFGLITTVFIAALVLFLARFERRALLLAPVLGGATGYGCQYIFTRIFVVDLPT